MISYTRYDQELTGVAGLRGLESEIVKLSGSESFSFFLDWLQDIGANVSCKEELFNTIDDREQGIITNVSFFCFLMRFYLKLRYGAAIIADIQQIIRFRTYHDRIPNHLNPEFIRLGKFLEDRSRQLGLTFKNYEQFAFEIRAGIGDTPIGMYAHCDVVPADEANWEHPPFSGVLEGNKVYGRGTMDNKSPLITSLYVMRAMKDTGLHFLLDPVLIIGTAEETSWEGIEYYLAHGDVPEINFVMDNSFPAVFAEKGIFNIALQHSTSPIIRFDRSPFMLLAIDAGIVSNQVPALTTAKIGVLSDESDNIDHILEESIGVFREKNKNCELEYSRDSQIIHVQTRGLAAHGSTPELGYNSLWDMIRFLVEELRVSGGPEIHLMEFLNRYACSDWLGKNLGISFDNPAMGPLTVNLGTLKQKDNHTIAVLNIRYPIGREQNDITSLFAQKVNEYNNRYGAELTFEARDGLAPIFTSPDTPIIQTLLKAYEETTGIRDIPLSCAGTTYAKVIPNAVGFGPSLPGTPDRAHTDNEYISLHEIFTMSQIYMTALLGLSLNNR